MRILYVDFGSLLTKDILEVFQYMGHSVASVKINNSLMDGVEPETSERIEKCLNEKAYDIVFSFDYSVSVAEVCRQKEKLYVSWIYDSPILSLYCNNVRSPWNRIFCFDTNTINDLKKMGVENIWYMPLGVNSRRLRKLKISTKERLRYEADVAFVGNMYEKSFEIYTLLKQYAPAELTGYMDGLISGQRAVYDRNVMDEAITDERLEQFQEVAHCTLAEHSFVTLRYIYNNIYFGKRIAYLDRINTLEVLSKKFKLDLYTSDKNAKIGMCINRGYVQYYDDMSKVFRCSKINLNYTIRSIRTGIPLRILDIMGAGGFTVTNYQKDLFQHFEEDKDIVIFRSTEELEDKIAYYLKNEKERESIAKRGCEKVLEEFDYLKLLNQMFCIVEKDIANLDEV